MEAACSHKTCTVTADFDGGFADNGGRTAANTKLGICIEQVGKVGPELAGKT